MPEKSIKQVSRPDRELYEKGMAAYQKDNLDYAITIFNQTLKNDPEFFECRQALRATQFRKVEVKSGFFKKMFGAAGKSPAIARAQMALRNHPEEAIRQAEQILNDDPNSVAAHKILADAALKLEMPKTAALSLEIARKNAPKDVDLGLLLAKTLSDLREIKKAEGIYNELGRSFPTNTEVIQAVKDFAANKTLIEGRYESFQDKDSSFRTALKDEEEAVALEQRGRTVNDVDTLTERIAHNIRAIEKEPGSFQLLRETAELCILKKDFDQALSFAEVIRSKGLGEDAGVEQLFSDINSKRIEHRMSEISDTDPEFESKRAAVMREKDEYDLQQLEARSAKYPNDLEVRFQIGKLYFKLENFSTAIQHFQRSQTHPHRKIASLGYLGKCFARKKMWDLAKRSLENAITEKLAFDDEKKDLLYELASIHEQTGNSDQAFEIYKSIFEMDIGYRDVDFKVTAYYEAQSKSLESSSNEN